MTDEDVKKSEIYLKEEYPEIARYISAVWKISKQHGYDGLDEVGRLWLIDFFIKDQLNIVQISILDLSRQITEKLKMR